LPDRHEPAVAVIELSRAFRTADQVVHAVDGVSFDVTAGEMVALMGPSGSGKTTLLNLIGGLDRPTGGRIELFGRAIERLAERELTSIRARTIGIVFQDPHLLPGLTAIENVVVASLPWRPARELAIEARELLSEVGLDHRRDFPPARLSGGERQRVAIARALAGGRPLLLADEPTGNLDTATTDEIIGLIDQLRRTRSMTVLIATHDPTVAAAADRIIRLMDGRLVGEQSFDTPTSLGVHEFGA
jgi:putative ABC transport system ATP-binding protein